MTVATSENGFDIQRYQDDSDVVESETKPLLLPPPAKKSTFKRNIQVILFSQIFRFTC